jgi:hypothetical protein
MLLCLSEPQKNEGVYSSKVAATRRKAFIENEIRNN